MRNKALLVALILALVASASCAKKKSAEQQPAPAKTFTVTVETDSTVTVAGKTVPIDSLVAVLKAQGCDSTAAVTLKPAGHVSMGTVDSVRSILHKLGVTKLEYKAPTS